MIFARMKRRKFVEGVMERNQVLLLYENSGNLEFVRNYLAIKGYTINVAQSYNEAVKMVGSKPIELFLTDFSFANDPTSVDYQKIKLINPVILLLRIQLQNSMAENPGDIEFFKLMLRTLDVLESTRSMYRYKIN